MKARIEQIVRKRRGLADVSERDVDVISLGIGRSGSADIHLADPRVRLDHAAIEGEGGRFEVRAIGDAVVLVDGRPAAVAALVPGTRVSIGPYELRIGEPPPGIDLAVAVELIQPFDAESAAALTDDMRSVARHLPGRRVVAWTLSLAIFVLFLALPVIAALSPGVRDATRMFRPLAVWNSGPISNVHRPIAENCTACHARPFVQVENAQCLACHATTRQHADPKMVDLGGERCESCHKEHNGRRLATRTADAFCAGCHDAIAKVAPATELANVGGFETAHPQFRPTLVTDAAGPVLSRISLDTRPKESSNLRFPHDKHLRREGLRTMSGTVTLTCASCHVPEAGGERMRPIAMEAQCGGCHTLGFERRFPDWTVPHGEPDKVRRTIAGLYSQIALAERREVDRARTDRQRPGELNAEERIQREADRAWVQARTDEAMATTFGAGGCGLCHLTERKADGWTVRPVRVVQEFMPKARFSHAKHTAVGCGECHAAPTSSASDDVLMPGIATCRGCHGGETPEPTKVASGCVACHAFHVHPVPIRSAEAAK
jgi:predicted CXXCH cytochrome family protein